ncbi:ferritin-like domain-containing protein [Lichenifustis flavocetrariae]|uniref:Ferritin-like domain-containing protein n=1 Tax=Lichenifustis flavocetrariae TaxID=2949735 RepID=A0AA42CKU4_9HYPH|nr:ferritin-like domain-containing protein [Lichenifustis flavocetrariae]MCW6509646.1 ferritin-like domain-containing protein [Lichenifustis flavocetrariae]
MSHDIAILDGIDPDLSNRLTNRRDLFAGAAVKLGALATAPLMLAAVSSQAFAQVPQQVADILNFALTLEYLEDEFYRTALAQGGLIPDYAGGTFQTISQHETAHVALLQSVLGGAAVAKPQFDFTARGKYRDVFTNFKTFAAVSQALEDTGVAAYKGQAPNLVGGGKLLTTALEIHSVEARHAASVRLLRKQKPWTGAFDKPLSKAQVLAIAGPFIAG